MMTAELRTIQIGIIVAAESLGLLEDAGRGEVAETGEGRRSPEAFSCAWSI